jgi:dipeptidase E
MIQLFLTSASDYVLDDIVKKLPKSPADYNVAFINTAAEVEEGDHWWVRAEKDKLISVGFQVDEFSITGMSSSDIEAKLAGKQVIYFCGGNTFYLLDQVIKTGCGEIIKRKVNEGVVYMGSSAGSMIAGVRIDLMSKIDDKSKAPDLKSTGLGIIDISILPHWGSDIFREGYLSDIESMYTEGVKILPLTNYQYLWVNGDNMTIVQVEK